MTEFDVRLGPFTLRSPLIAASGTVGSVVDFAKVAAWEAYGAAVAKSVSEEPWPGKPPPRLGAVGAGMINAVGIQNPGIDAWVSEVGPRLHDVDVPIWGSAVGHTPDEFAKVAARLEEAGVAAVEINLSCPNLDGGDMFAERAESTHAVVEQVRAATALPLGAKLSPSAADIVGVAGAAAAAGADWVVLTNTVPGAAIDPKSRRPVVSAVTGGVSGAPLKPIALRCVWMVHQAHPDLPIVGCGGVTSGTDMVEYFLAGASAVAAGTVHFAEPRAGRRLLKELARHCRRARVDRVDELIGGAVQW